MTDEEAIHLAEEKGAKLEQSRWLLQQDNRVETLWSWTWGQRSSSDQYCISFQRKAEAARHFLNSREGGRMDI